MSSLAEHHPPTFQVLAHRFLPEGWKVLADLADSCKRIVKAVHQVAQSGQPFEPIALPKRLCPVTGVDVSHQSLTKPLVNPEALKVMFDEDRNQFDQIAARFLNTDEMTFSRKRQVEWLLNRIERQWAAIRPR